MWGISLPWERWLAGLRHWIHGNAVYRRTKIINYLSSNTSCFIVRKRNHPATNLPGRPPHHRQVSCIPIAKWKQLLNSDHLRKTKQPALNLPTTEQASQHGMLQGQKRIMRVQHEGTALLGLFNVLLNAFILSFIT